MQYYKIKTGISEFPHIFVYAPKNMEKVLEDIDTIPGSNLYYFISRMTKKDKFYVVKTTLVPTKKDTVISWKTLQYF